MFSLKETMQFGGSRYVDELNRGTPEMAAMMDEILGIPTGYSKNADIKSIVTYNPKNW